MRNILFFKKCFRNFSQIQLVLTIANKMFSWHAISVSVSFVVSPQIIFSSEWESLFQVEKFTRYRILKHFGYRTSRFVKCVWCSLFRWKKFNKLTYFWLPLLCLIVLTDIWKLNLGELKPKRFIQLNFLFYHRLNLNG